MSMKLKDKFELILTASGINMVREYRFHPVRLWRFDYADVANKIAVEIEGGVFMGGRHTHGVWYAKDCVKYNEAALHGWIVLRYATPKDAAAFTSDYQRALSLVNQRKAPGAGSAESSTNLPE